MSDGSTPVEIRGWLRDVPNVEPSAIEQVRRIASMGDIVKHPVCVMPDLHLGNGVAVGAVIPTTRAIIPSAVGVDIGCGIIAVKTTLKESDLPANLEHVRLAVEIAIPHGRTHNGRPEADAGNWRQGIPQLVADAWKQKPGTLTKGIFGGLSPDAMSGAQLFTDVNGSLEARFKRLCAKHPDLARANHVNHLGTLGTGNHFVEVCVDDQDDGTVWFMIHSGSRGIGNKIGMSFIELAKKDMGKLLSSIPSADLACVREGTALFDDYVEALHWAQDFARVNRLAMMANMIYAMRHNVPGLKNKDFKVGTMAVNCHHNYVEKIDDFGGVWLTRKGATSARKGELGIIPGSMGVSSYIVRGKGNADSYNSCSHGAGRAYSRGEAVRRFTVADHELATAKVCCRKDKDVLDETPAAYKDITKVMAAQADLVEIVHTLRQVVCVKG